MEIKKKLSEPCMEVIEYQDDCRYGRTLDKVWMYNDDIFGWTELNSLWSENLEKEYKLMSRNKKLKRLCE